MIVNKVSVQLRYSAQVSLEGDGTLHDATQALYAEVLNIYRWFTQGQPGYTHRFVSIR